MKKMLVLLLALSLLTACTAQETVEEAPQEDAWGLTLALEFTPGGAELVFTQSGGAPAGELMSGSYYVIERREGDAWEKVPFRSELDGENIGWTAEGWMIPMEDTVRYSVDWSFLYGELPAGEYRIGKSVADFCAAGDFEEKMYYAEFAVID